MNLHLDKENFKIAIDNTANFFGIKQIYVEKDYWITMALKAILTNKDTDYAVFKGGTSLVKAFNIIHRFSEDIDIVVIKNTGETDTQIKKKLKLISKNAEVVIPEIQLNNITSKHGLFRKTAHTFEKLFSDNYGQVRDVIILEASSLGNFEPYTTKPIQSFIAEMLLANNSTKVIETYALQPFEVKVLAPQRTMCEKMMSLVRFSYSANPVLELQKKVRHCYDLHFMLQDATLQDFFQSKAFDTMLNAVGNDDVLSYKSGNEWLQFHPAQALIFNETITTWQQVKRAYTNNFSELVYGKFPTEKEIENTLLQIANRLTTIKWLIKL